MFGFKSLVSGNTQNVLRSHDMVTQLCRRNLDVLDSGRQENVPADFPPLLFLTGFFWLE